MRSAVPFLPHSAAVPDPEAVACDSECQVTGRGAAVRSHITGKSIQHDDIETRINTMQPLASRLRLLIADVILMVMGGHLQDVQLSCTSGTLRLIGLRYRYF
jgi:hypothetical protein